MSLPTPGIPFTLPASTFYPCRVLQLLPAHPSAPRVVVITYTPPSLPFGILSIHRSRRQLSVPVASVTALVLAAEASPFISISSFPEWRRRATGPRTLLIVTSHRKVRQPADSIFFVLQSLPSLSLGLLPSHQLTLCYCLRPPGSSHDDSDLPPERAHAVRFSSNVDEISLPAMDRPRNDSSATPEQIQALTDCLHGTPLQEQRAQIYAFQPVSLPPSRVRRFSPCEPAPPRGFFLFSLCHFL